MLDSTQDAYTHKHGSPRRDTIRQFYANAGLWGLGNGLVSSSLVVYLAGNYGAKGFAISLILAAPRLVGVLRLGGPLLMAWIGNQRRFAIQSYLASALMLVALPIISAPRLFASQNASLATLISCWTLYHFFEFLGTIAMWSWIGNAIPLRIRGRFLGRRGAILNAGQVLGMLAGAAATYTWQEYTTTSKIADQAWLGYAACVICGALSFALATIPLYFAREVGNVTQFQTTLQQIFRPFRDREFLRYLVYGGWFSLANGLIGSAQYLFQMRVLEISYATRLAFDGTSQGLQSTIMPWIGRVIDRNGNVPVLVVSQLLVALSTLFFLVASPENWWWIAGAYGLWIAYAGINVAMPNLMLSLTRHEDYASYAAAWFAWTQLVYALSTLAGGLLFDWTSTHGATLKSAGIDYFTAFFLAGFVLRLIAAGLAARVKEPSTHGEA